MCGQRTDAKFNLPFQDDIIGAESSKGVPVAGFCTKLYAKRICCGQVKTIVGVADVLGSTWLLSSRC